jgi:GTPase SAR1 family protein
MAQNTIENERQIKIVFLGNECVGKSRLVGQIIGIDAPASMEFYVPTIEEMHSFTFMHRDCIMMDTGGSSAFDRVRPCMCRDATDFVLCYSIDDLKSFLTIQEKVFHMI